jgi:uncharacterized phage protein (TIGR02220 family)
VVVMLNAGYIKIFRKITEWEWYTDENVMRVFLHCLIKSNYTEKNWRGITINRGSFVTSYNSLASDLKLTKQQIRTALNKLKSTHELTLKTTNKYSIISINNYDMYQDNNTQDNTQITFKQHSNNTQITPTKNIKNIKKEKNDKKDIYIVEQIDYKGIIDYLNMKCGTKYKHTSQATKRLIQARVNQGFTYDDFKTVIDKKSREWLNTDMAKYLRPETLFGNKFESYLNQQIKRTSKTMIDLDDVDIPF